MKKEKVQTPEGHNISSRLFPGRQTLYPEKESAAGLKRVGGLFTGGLGTLPLQETGVPSGEKKEGDYSILALVKGGLEETT